MPHGAPECFRTLQNVPDCSIVLLNAPECSMMLDRTAAALPHNVPESGDLAPTKRGLCHKAKKARFVSPSDCQGVRLDQVRVSADA